MASDRNQSDALRLLLEKRLSDAEAEALRNDGTIPPSTLREVDRLARLVEIRRQSASLPKRRRWPVAAIFVLTLILASILLFTHVHQTEIELQVILSEVGLVFSASHPFTDAMQLSSLGASGLEGVTVPSATDAQTRSSLKLTVANKQPSQLTLAPIFLPVKSRVWLRVGRFPGSCRLSIQSKDLQFRADVSGSIDIAGTKPIMEFQSPKRFLLHGGSREIELELVPSNTGDNPFLQHLPLEAISMARVEEFMDNDKILASKVSSILSGTLYFESLGGRERKLRQSEALELEQANGLLEKLALVDGKIVLEFHGVVRGIKAGDEARTNLMPTCLEWLQARHGLYLLWGTAIYLLGLVVGVLRWAGARV
jgi:hypothetical protein